MPRFRFSTRTVDSFVASVPSFMGEGDPNRHEFALTLISRKYSILICLYVTVVVVVVVFAVDLYVSGFRFVFVSFFSLLFNIFSLYRFLWFHLFFFRRGENNDFPHFTLIFVSVSQISFSAILFLTFFRLHSHHARARVVTIRQKGTFKNICVEKSLEMSVVSFFSVLICLNVFLIFSCSIVYYLTFLALFWHLEFFVIFVCL